MVAVTAAASTCASPPEVSMREPASPPISRAEILQLPRSEHLLADPPGGNVVDIFLAEPQGIGPEDYLRFGVAGHERLPDRGIAARGHLDVEIENGASFGLQHATAADADLIRPPPTRWMARHCACAACSVCPLVRRNPSRWKVRAALLSMRAFSSECSSPMKNRS